MRVTMDARSGLFEVGETQMMHRLVHVAALGLALLSFGLALPGAACAQADLSGT